MIIKPRQIPAEGLELRFEIPPSAINDHHDKDLEIFTQDIQCDLHLESDQREIFVSGRASTQIKPTCARCGESFEHTCSVSLLLTCAPENATQGRRAPHAKKGQESTDSYQEADEGFVPYNGSELDLSELVREQILLSIPIRYLCKETCKGLCVRCGANLNLGTHECKTPNPEQEACGNGPIHIRTSD